MKLECPSCHQKYNLTNQTIPANKTVVACKVCTKPIPLKRGTTAAAQKTPPVSCGYCGKKVNLGALKAAADVEKINCPSCKHPIVLSAQEKIAPTASEPGFDSVHLKCSQCEQTYTLNRAKIPANASSATCKSCGTKIPIPGSLKKHHSPDQKVEEAQAAPSKKAKKAQTVEAIKLSAASKTKKPWFRALLALLMALLIGFGIWFGGSWLLDFFKTGWEVLIESKPRPTMKTPAGTFSSKPMMAMRLHTPLVTHAIKGRISRNSPHHKSMAALNAVGLERVEIFMLPQSELLVVPALYIQGREIRHLEKLLAGYNLIEKAIWKDGAGKYVVDPEALGKKYGKDYPAITYTIWFHKNTILVAPQILMKDAKVTLSRLTESKVSGFAGSLSSPRQAGAIAVQIPRTLENNWPVKLKQNPVLQADPRLAMTTGMGTSVLVQLGDALKAIDMLGARLKVTGEDRQRTFFYRQRFRSRGVAKKFNAQLEAGNASVQNTQWLVREMLSLFQDRRIEYNFKLNGKDLDMQVQWLPHDDQLIMNALIRAMFGKVVETSKITVAKMAPSTGKVRTITTDMPQYTLTVDREKIEKVVQQGFQASLFPAQFWDGKEPRMNIDLDMVQFPNNALAQASYSVLSAQTKDGTNVLRGSDQVVQHTLRPGDPSPGFIAVNVKAGTAPDSLSKADIEFQLKVPTRLNEVDFTTTDPAGATRVAGKIPVKLKRIDKDVVEIAFQKNSGVFIYAFNRNKKPLKVSETIESGNTISRRFHGPITSVKVLVVEEQLELPVNLTVDLNGGQSYKLAHRPETPDRIRFDNMPLRTYKTFTKGMLNKLSVQWHESVESEWVDSLSIDLPDGPFHGRANWEVNFFGSNKPVQISGNQENTDYKASFTLDKGALLKANAAVGQAEMTFSTKISRQNFVKSSDKQPIIQKMPTGKIITVIFDQNEVTLTPFDDDVIQIIAYDENDRRLKRDSYSQNKGLMRKQYFWGVPTRVEVDLAEGRISKTLDFDIVKRSLDQKAYEAFKQELVTQREIAASLKKIAAARKLDRNRYGDDVAGLYYLFNRKQKVPMKLIDAALAHSDPAAAKRFGYPLKPYKGYYFKVLAGVSANGKTEKFQHDKRGYTVNWSKGAIKALRYRELPTIAAIPLNKSQPTFYEKAGRIYTKQLNGEELKYRPQDPHEQGWEEI